MPEACVLWAGRWGTLDTVTWVRGFGYIMYISPPTQGNTDLVASRIAEVLKSFRMLKVDLQGYDRG